MVSRSRLTMLSLLLALISLQRDVISVVGAPEVLHFNLPEVSFSSQTKGLVGPREGNVVSASPDNAIVYALSADGTLTAFDPVSGVELFYYSPSAGGGSTICRSGISYFGVYLGDTVITSIAAPNITSTNTTEPNVTSNNTTETNATSTNASTSSTNVTTGNNTNANNLNPANTTAPTSPKRIVNATQPFLIYSIIDTSGGIDRGSRVVALAHPTGEVLWISGPLDGGAVGTPLISSSGKHVFINHNSNLMTAGIFTILNAADGSVLYSQRDDTNPVGALGIYHNPIEGYYEGGEGNSNDLLVWSNSPRSNGTRSGRGGSFAFQFPPMYVDGTSDTLSVTPLRTSATWMTTTAPVIANRGYSMYFGVNSNQLLGWVGEPGLDRNGFHRKPTYEQDQLGKGRPGYLPPYSTPTVNSDASMLYVNLANEFVTAFRPNLEVAWSTPAKARNSGFVAKTVLSHDDKVVYFAESGGILRANKAATGELLWEIFLEDAILADFSLSPTGESLYVGTEGGRIVGLTVAEPTPPCYLCRENGTLPSLPFARMDLPGLASGTCLEVMELGLQREIRKESCLTIQLLAQTRCGCQTTDAPTSVPSVAPSTSSPTIAPTTLEPTNMPTFEPSLAPSTLATSGAAPLKFSLAGIVMLWLALLVI